MPIQLQNIAQQGNNVHLFQRVNDKLVITQDKTYRACYYEPQDTGSYTGYDGTKLRKIEVDNPFNIKKYRSGDSFSSDISLTKQYLINKVDTIVKSNTKYLFLDIEVYAKEIPNVTTATQPISCVSIYNNYAKSTKTWWILDYKGTLLQQEKKLFDDVLTYITTEQPDLMCLAPNTIVNTEFGIKDIKSVKVGEKLVSWSTNHFTLSEVIHTTNLVKPGYSIHTPSSNLEASSDHIHPILDFKITDTENGFFKDTKTHNLKINDYLLFPINFLPKPTYKCDFSWLVGYYMGDGTVGKRERFEIKDKNKESLNNVVSVLNKLGIIDIKNYDYKTIDCSVLYSYSDACRELLDKMYLIKKDFTNWYMKLNVSQKCSFVGGFIDAEGSSRGSMLVVVNTNKEIIDCISNTLWGIGIPNSYESNSEDDRLSWHQLVLCLNENNKYLDIRHPEKKNFCTHIYKSVKKDVIPIKSHLRNILKKWNIKNNTSVSLFETKTNNVSRKDCISFLKELQLVPLNSYKHYYLTRLINFIESYHFEKITNIIPLGDIPVVEISLKESPYFIANNVLTHNCSWNIDFDYTYMYYRYLKLYNKSGTLAEVLSPIKLSHSGSGDYPDAKYPCGISIMDYLAMFKKVFMREPSYTLDAISQKYINDKSWGASNFGELTQDIKDKNVNDVVRMQKLEDKFKLIEYFDEIRILTKTEWEDLYHNSFIVENMLFQEAHRQNIILPNRPTQQYGDEDSEETFEGAAREALKTGALFDIGKFDLTSAYPTMMVEFCLDATNIVTDGSGLDVNGVQFQQNPNALIPSMVRRIMILKDTRKAELAQMKKGTDEYTTAKIKYDAIKGVANSTFGVMGFSSFRLYDNRVASAITYLVRNLLAFSRNQVANLGREVIYWDTDSVFITGISDISKELNEGIQQWAKLLGKDSINLKYEYEGYFSKIFIIALCRYVGHLVSKKGTEVEIKGAEAKRASSTKYEGQFQLALIDKMLAKETQENILTWIEKERNQLRLYPLEEVSFPCKISNKEYKVSKKTGKAVYPIFMRAVDNTNAIKKLEVPVGELLWWAYVKPIMQSSKGTDVDVLAFTKEDKDVVRQHKVDWNRMIERNINTKAENIFKAQGWSVEQLQNEGQLSLF